MVLNRPKVEDICLVLMPFRDPFNSYYDILKEPILSEKDEKLPTLDKAMLFP